MNNSSSIEVIKQEIETNILTLFEKGDSSSFLIITCGEYFVQVGVSPKYKKRFFLEAVSNNFLGEKFKLNQEQINSILEMGFELETEYNFTKSFSNNDEVTPELVNDIIILFDNIYGVLKALPLEYEFDLPSTQEKEKEQELKGKNKGIFIIAIIVLVLAGIGYIGNFNRYNSDPRKEKIKNQLDSYNGTHIKLTRYIKESMNDPDSYENVETKYWDMGDYLVVYNKFRGRNVFNGKVINSVKAKVDLDGDVIEILETSP